jgi:hypothetical protein
MATFDHEGGHPGFGPSCGAIPAQTAIRESMYEASHDHLRPGGAPACFHFARRRSGPQEHLPDIARIRSPTNIVDPMDGTDRLFLTEQTGRMWVFENDSLVTS